MLFVIFNFNILILWMKIWFVLGLCCMVEFMWGFLLIGFLGNNIELLLIKKNGMLFVFV